MKRRSTCTESEKEISSESTAHNGKMLSPGVSRRDFLRIGSAASFGIATGAMWMPGLALGGTDETSRVVIVIDEGVTETAVIQPHVVRTMIDEGIKALMDATTAEDAWMDLLPNLAPDLQTGIKINAANPNLPSHIEVSTPLAESLASVTVGGNPYPLNQITVWDRTEMELLAAGYTLNTGTTGIKCFSSYSSGIGFNPNAIDVNGTSQLVSRLYTDYSDYSINLSCIKDHAQAGVTTALKNHYGTISNGSIMHGNNCDPYIPALNRALIDAYDLTE